MADRTKRSEEKKKQKKEKRRVKGKRRRRNWNRRRGPRLALSVDECLGLPLALHYLPVYRLGLILVWNLSLLPREPSIIQSLYCAHNISGESLAGGIPAGGVGTLQTWNWDRQPVMPIMPVMSAMAMSWFLMQVSETERTHENACSVMNLTAGASQSTKNVFRRGAWLRFSPHGKLRSF